MLRLTEWIILKFVFIIIKKFLLYCMYKYIIYTESNKKFTISENEKEIFNKC